MPRLACAPRVARPCRRAAPRARPEPGGLRVAARPRGGRPGHRRRRRDRPGRRGRARHRDRRRHHRRRGTTTGGTATGWRHDDRRRHHDRRRLDRRQRTGGGAGGGSGGGGGGQQGGGDNAADGGGDRAPAATASRTGPASPTTRSPSPTPPTSPARCPGIFESAQEATSAYVAYFNSTSDICGRKLELVTLRQPHRRRRRPAGLHQGLRRGVRDGRLDVGLRLRRRRRPPSAAACPTSARPRSPRDRNACSTCFAAQSVNTGEWRERAAATSSRRTTRTPPQHAAVALHQRRRRRRERPASRSAAMTKQGWNFDVRPGHRRRGVQLRAVRPADEGQGRQGRLLRRRLPELRAGWPQAMQQQGFKPDVYLRTPPTTTPTSSSRRRRRRRHLRLPQLRAVRGGQHQQGDAALPELARSRCSPAPTPTYFGLFAWSAARLFVEQAIALGGRLDPGDAGRRAHEGRQLDRQRPARPAARRRQADRRLLAVHPAQRRQVEPGRRRPSTPAPARTTRAEARRP